MRRGKFVPLSMLTVLCCSGCQSVGPGMLSDTHPSYNRAMMSVVDQQMLNNLVRLRYRENPTFLDISSITENQKLGFDAGIDKSELYTNSSHGKGSFLGPKVMFGVSQSPTISYRPLRGKEFIKQLMTPIPLNAVLGLSRSGWKIERVFNTCVERINDIENAPSASGPTPWNKPDYETFYRATAILKRLEERGCVSVGRDLLQINVQARHLFHVVEF